jgi:hypothetical protein
VSKNKGKYCAKSSSKVLIYGPCAICGHTIEGDLNFEAIIHHNGVVRCFDLKACRRRQRKRVNK